MTDANRQKVQKDQDGRTDAAEDAPAKSVSNPAPAPGAGAGPASTPAASFSPTRPPYIPQFSAATQMILKRISGEPSSLSAALSHVSRSPAITANIPSATYEDAKRRLVMGMNTSTQMTVQMPSPLAPRPSPSALPMHGTARPKLTTSTAGMSAIRKVTAGLTASSRPTPVKTAAARFIMSETKIKKTKTVMVHRGLGGKRKRARTQDDDDASSISGLSSNTEPEAAPQSNTTPAPAPPPPTMTKSGRQVLKPTAYNPAAMDAASKKRSHHYGKRTAEQALCKNCTRMHSPANNQMVFCDGCNEGWHQRCHEPWIGDDVVRDEHRAWFCGTCQAKRGPSAANKRPRLDHPRPKEEPVRESWAGKPPQQKRAYLLTLPQQELVGLLMSCLELHPDLPIFPASPSPGADHHAHHHHHQSGATLRSLFAGTTTEGLFPRSDAHPNGQINFVRKVANGRPAATAAAAAAAASGGSITGTSTTTNKGRPGSGKGSQKEDSQERMNEDEDDEEFDPLAALWPRAGMGLYRLLPPDTEDGERLSDENDFEAFSVIVYDERGRKVEENGMRV